MDVPLTSVHVRVQGSLSVDVRGRPCLSVDVRGRPWPLAPLSAPQQVHATGRHERLIQFAWWMLRCGRGRSRLTP